MDKTFDEDAWVEPERYELFAESGGWSDVTRRQFFKVLGAGIAIFFMVRDALGQSGETAPSQLGSWLHVGEDGKVTVYTGKVEVGQNIRTSLSQVVAEELRVPLSAVEMVMGDTDLTPYDRGTFGSRTTPTMAPQLRKAAATAREAITDLAAAAWQVDRSEVSAVDGRVDHAKTGRSMGYGEVTRGVELMQGVREDVSVTPVAAWTVAGHSAKKVNGRDLVTGSHKYASDMQLPGMLHGKVLRPPAFDAKLISVDASRASAIPGVTVVNDGEFVGVVAADAWVAQEALSAVVATWETTQQPARKDLFQRLKSGATSPRSSQAEGAVAEGLSKAQVTAAQTYTVDYIAHAPLEPRAALAAWTDGKLTVWTGTQRPFGVRSQLMNLFELPEEKVRVITPDTGSGYGGKHTGEAALEAARLARAVQKPVKVVWTREEEFTWAYFRPAGVIDIQGGVQKDGTLTAWSFHNYNSGSAGIKTLYEVPNIDVAYYPTKSPLRQGSYRGLATTANHFAREVHMDVLAHKVNMDPLAFRKRNLKDPRLLAVFEAACEYFGWGLQKAGSGRGFGLAGGFDKGGYVATCAEVAVDRKRGTVTVVRVVEAFECGAILNPDQLHLQVEGAIIQGLGGALFEAIDFENGKILNPFFAQYRVPRFADVPEIDIVLLNRKDLPSAGAGEAPIIGIAPAIGNAIFNATGVRLHSLPMVPNGLKI
ncbi:MAG: molybdopterin-dependent oxidoreductase [bacterium]|nr:molybdopterin-dependent oxidoreductase [bacterium]